mgnify:CR=1 FL=1
MTVPANPGDANYSPLLLLYGGGHDVLGQFEDVEPSDGPLYRTPGFSSAAGGGYPRQPGHMDYPDTTTKKSNDKPWKWVTSTTEWKHITWQIEPEMMRVYMRKSNQDTSFNELLCHMAIPKDSFGSSYILDKLNSVHGTTISSKPGLYKWFSAFNSIRIYFRAWNDNICYFANFKVTKSSSISTHTTHIADNDKSGIQVLPNPVYNNSFRVSFHSSESVNIGNF